jgi:AbrB family looped-hinge helix DNA binding protein
MTKLSYLTPDGQITIPRTIMKSLNINGGSDIMIDVQSGVLIIKKIEQIDLESEETLIYKAG